MNNDERGVTSDSAPVSGDGQGRPLKPYHRPVLRVHGSLRDLTQGVASGNGDGCLLRQEASTLSEAIEWAGARAQHSG